MRRCLSTVPLRISVPFLQRNEPPLTPPEYGIGEGGTDIHRIREGQRFRPSPRRLDEMQFPSLEIELPGWVEDAVPEDETFSTVDDRMGLAVELSRRNAERGTGGPFGAAVFREGEPVALGVNLVPPTGVSVLHAEVVALALAHRVAGPDLEGLELVTSTEPCAMCIGATHWSGVTRLVTGARGSDAESVGFDEGPKPADWEAELERRGVAVTRDVRRQEAAEVLRSYAEAGGEIYGP